MSDLCIPFLHNFHLKNPFVVYKRVYVKDPKFLEVPWKEDRNRISGLQNATSQGSEFYFLLCGFTGCRHIDFTLNFLQTRMKTGFRQTYSADWTQHTGHLSQMHPGTSAFPRVLLSACARHFTPADPDGQTLLWGHNLLFASGSPEVEVSVLLPCQGPVRRPLGVATGRGMFKEKGLEKWLSG